MTCSIQGDGAASAGGSNRVGYMDFVLLVCGRFGGCARACSCLFLGVCKVFNNIFTNITTIARTSNDYMYWLRNNWSGNSEASYRISVVSWPGDPWGGGYWSIGFAKFLIIY